ncbi:MULTISPECIES: hypothetical protein [unclassified Pseudomonas]|uniref:hypothetical protein n=1 Tax=unclassified Pseudomonas TaxID=196821 RepID=UPI0021BB7780|nr:MULTISPECIES: hypothetical protein [unclassified Pseudomonas]MCT8165027.1 hypothetical protein [Pseudomonas sp. HD6422]MCT8183925.1 hypothetical protein [Pseudomonas sp. HD6421]
MLDDITTTIKAQLYDRITSPLSGAFIVSWAAWNWRFLTVLFSDLKAPIKLSYIETYIFPTTSLTLINGLLLPFVSATLFVTVYPYPAKWFYKISQLHKKNLRSVQQSIEDETPMTLEQASQLRKSYNTIQSQHEHDISQKISEIAASKEALREAENSLKGLTELLSIKSEDLNTSKTEQARLNRQLEQLTIAKDRLSSISKSLAPRLSTSEDKNSLVIWNAPGLKEKSPQMKTPPPLEPEATIERSITNHINVNRILSAKNPSIVAAGGNIYLQYTIDRPISLIIGHYNQDDKEDNSGYIDLACIILTLLDHHGLPRMN